MVAARTGHAQNVGDPVVAKVITKCQAAVTKAQATYRTAATKAYKACVDAVFACVQVKPDDVGCLAKATFACDKQLAKVDGAATTLRVAVERRCGAAVIPFATLVDPDGADLDAVAFDCTHVDVPALADLGDYEDCLVRAERCAAEDLVRFGTPRAEELFAIIGRELRSAFCPVPAPTATPTATATSTPLATSTATATGATITPTPTATPTSSPGGPTSTGATATGGGTPNPTATATAIPFNRIFVTSATFAANFGGVAAGDTTCQTIATNAGLGGTWGAWLSDSTTDAKARLGTARGFIRIDGAPFGDTIASITTSPHIFNALHLDEHGADVGTVEVWTGTDADGTKSSTTCANWTTSLSGTAQTGSTGAGPGAWTQTAAASCGVPRHLYCFEKTKTAILTPSPAAGNTVFVTQGTFTPAAAPAGGTVGADALCAAEASAASLSGTYVALLATSTQSAASRVVLSALNVRKDGIFVGSSATVSGGGPVASGIWQTAAGTYVTGPGVWTGAATPSTVGTAASTCDNWTSTSSTTGTFGRPNFTDATWWSAAQPSSCSSAFRLYCVPQ